MGTVKAVLRKKRNPQGLYPIAIRITKDRTPAYMRIGQFIKLEDWDETNRCVKKSHRNSKRINNMILSEVAKANDKLIALEAKDKLIQSSAVKENIKRKTQLTSFFEYAAKYLKNLEDSGKENQLSADKPRIKHFREFLKGRDIDFRKINTEVLRKYQAWLKVTRKISDWTVTNHLVVIRTIYNQAINDRIVKKKHYPFGKGKIEIKFPESVKIGLDGSYVETLETIELESKAQRHALNAWLLTYYFAGMRVSDVLRLKWTDIQNGRLYYQMGKNKKADSLKIPLKALTILNQYSDPNSGNRTVFPELNEANFKDAKEMHRLINNANGKFNKRLRDVAKKAGIDTKLTMHISRHTFGNMSGDRIPVQMLQKLYRHTDIKTTINYQKNFMFKDADEALESVIK